MSLVQWDPGGMPHNCLIKMDLSLMVVEYVENGHFKGVFPSYYHTFISNSCVIMIAKPPFQVCREPAQGSSAPCLSSDLLKCVTDVSESGLPPELVHPLPVDPCAANPEPESLVQPLSLVPVNSGDFVSMPDLSQGGASENPDQVTKGSFLESAEASLCKSVATMRLLTIFTPVNHNA